MSSRHSSQSISTLVLRRSIAASIASGSRPPRAPPVLAICSIPSRLFRELLVPRGSSGGPHVAPSRMLGRLSARLSSHEPHEHAVYQAGEGRYWAMFPISILWRVSDMTHARSAFTGLSLIALSLMLIGSGCSADDASPHDVTDGGSSGAVGHAGAGTGGKAGASSHAGTSGATTGAG